jgi:hypothetical protein
MTRRAGSADLPLHGGHVLKWLAERMTRLAAVMSQAIVHHYGRNELLRRLCHAFRFQSLLLAAGGRLRSRPIAEFTYENAINLPALGAEGNPGDRACLQLDDDVAGRIVLGVGSGRDDTGGVVFLDDEWADAARG